MSMSPRHRPPRAIHEQADTFVADGRVRRVAEADALQLWAHDDQLAASGHLDRYLLDRDRRRAASVSDRQGYA